MLLFVMCFYVITDVYSLQQSYFTTIVYCFLITFQEDNVSLYFSCSSVISAYTNLLSEISSFLSTYYSWISYICIEWLMTALLHFPKYRYLRIDSLPPLFCFYFVCRGIQTFLGTHLCIRSVKCFITAAVYLSVLILSVIQTAKKICQ